MYRQHQHGFIARHVRLLLTFCGLLVSFSALGFSAEKQNSGWSLYVDNDLFALGKRDYDYTGGVAFKQSGARAQTALLSVDKGLGWLNDAVGVSRQYAATPHFTTHNIEYGFTLFTPVELKSSAAILNQHPYASLFFVSNTRMVVAPQAMTTYQSSLTLGVLGLPLAREIQTTIHRVTGGNIPQGWRHQISAGGEPTLRYSLLRSKSYVFTRPGHNTMEVKLSSEANIGFSTDAGVGASLRYGSIHSPWWSFNQHNAEYISLGSPAFRSEKDQPLESYLWTGVSVKYRFYNAILQGQFRHSDVTYQRDELVPIILEAWLGYTQDLTQQWQLSVFVRARNHEIDLPTEHDPVWGGFIISKSF